MIHSKSMSCGLYKAVTSLLLIILFAKCGSDEENYSIQIENLVTSEEFEDYTFQLDTSQYTFQLNLESEIYNSHYGSEKYVIGESADWQKRFWSIFLMSKDDRNLISEIIKVLNSDNFSEKDFVVKATRFVQGAIAYDHDKAFNIEDHEVYFPYETIFLKSGVCSDKSILLAKILIQAGYQICFFIYPQANHMALGIKVDDKGSYNSGFCFIESTAYSKIGEIPEKIGDDQVLDDNPQVIVPEGSNGTKRFRNVNAVRNNYRQVEEKFGKNYFAASTAIKKLLIKKHSMEQEMRRLKQLYQKDSSNFQNHNCNEESNHQCREITEHWEMRIYNYNQLIDSSNNLIEQINESIQSENE